MTLFGAEVNRSGWAELEPTFEWVAGEPTTYALRATTVFRREEGTWRAVHRHGDPYRDS